MLVGLAGELTCVFREDVREGNNGGRCAGGEENRRRNKWGMGQKYLGVRFIAASSYIPWRGLCRTYFCVPCGRFSFWKAVDIRKSKSLSKVVAKEDGAPFVVYMQHRPHPRSRLFRAGARVIRTPRGELRHAHGAPLVYFFGWVFGQCQRLITAVVPLFLSWLPAFPGVL